MNISDEVYWSIPFVVAPGLGVAAVAVAGRLPRWRRRAQAWLDRTLGQEPLPAHLGSSGPTVGMDLHHVRILPLDPDGKVVNQWGEWSVSLKLEDVDRSVIDVIWGGREWRPYDWQVDGDSWTPGHPESHLTHT